MIFNCALLVDDSRSARFALRKLLERNGIQVDVAEDATQALEYLNNRHPDIIFMDHFMPGMDGFEVSRIIRNSQSTADIPIVMCTSNEGDEYFQEAKTNGANAILTKPTTAAKLFEVLNELENISSSPVQVQAEKSEPAVTCAQDLSRRSSDEQLEAHIARMLESQLPQLRENVTSGLDMIIKPLLQSYIEKAVVPMRQELDSLVEQRCRELFESTSQVKLELMVVEELAQMREQIEAEFSEQIADIYSGIGKLRASQSLKKADSGLVKVLSEQAADTARKEAAKALVDVQNLACQSAQNETNTLFKTVKKEFSVEVDHKLSLAADAAAQKARQEAYQVSCEKVQQAGVQIKKRFGRLFFVSGVALFTATLAVFGMLYLLRA